MQYVAPARKVEVLLFLDESLHADVRNQGATGNDALQTGKVDETAVVKCQPV